MKAVLRIRTIQERIARGEVARTRRDHQYAVAVEERVWTLIDDLAPPRARGLSVGELERRHEQVNAGLLSTVALRADTERAEESVTVATSEWTEAARRVEALERLAERIAAAQQAEAVRLAGNELDDLVLARRAAGLDPTEEAA